MNSTFYYNKQKLSRRLSIQKKITCATMWSSGYGMHVVPRQREPHKNKNQGILVANS